MSERVLLCILALVAAGSTCAQPYPARPIRLVVPFSAGAGVTDIMARLVGQRLGTSLGQSVVIDNRPGAAGIPGTELVARATPDGYTLLVTNVSFAVNQYLYPKLPYDSLKDFVPVTLLNTAPLVMVVHPSVSAKTVKELVALAASRPGQLNYGSGGIGTTPHLAGELFNASAGITATHVPYKGGAPALSDLMGGQLNYMIENMPGTMPFVRSGKLRALAISSAKRSPLEPALPTIAESGVPGYEVIGWNGIVAARGTPAAVVSTLQREIAAILETADMKQQLTALGAEAGGNTPQAFEQFIRAEMKRWGAIIREKDIKGQ